MDGERRRDRSIDRFDRERERERERKGEGGEEEEDGTFRERKRRKIGRATSPTKHTLMTSTSLITSLITSYRERERGRERERESEREREKSQDNSCRGEPVVTLMIGSAATSLITIFSTTLSTTY